MTNLAQLKEAKPLKMQVVRIESIFEDEIYYPENGEIVIKDYVYSPQKRVIA